MKRSDINGLLRKSYAPRSNLTKEENKALLELKGDKDMSLLTANKSVAMVVLDKKDYIETTQELPGQPAYRTIERDLTNKLKSKLIPMLRKIKGDTWMEENLYKTKQPTGCTPKILSFAQNPQNRHPIRPIASSRDSATYGVAKNLAKMLWPLVGKSPHYIHSTKDFVNKVSKVPLLPGEGLCSYDVLALFISVSIDPALNIIRELLEQDTSL